MHPSPDPPSLGATAVSHAALAACLVLAVLPLLAVDYPPVFDYANHLSRAYVIAHLDEVPVFAAHFRTTSFLIPNVLADLVLLALLPALGIIAAGKALLILTLALTLTGAYVLGRVLSGRFQPLPLLAALLLYNEGFFWGFLNYDLGLGLLLWGLAAWLALEGRRGGQLAAGAGFALVIFLAHLASFGLYACAIAAVELERAWRTRFSLRRLAASAAQFVPPLALFYGLSPSRGLALTAEFDFSLFGKVMPFTRLLSSGNPSLDIFTASALVGMVVALLACGAARLHRLALLVAALFLVLIETLPFTMLGSYFLDSRIVIAFALMVAAGLSQKGGHLAPVAVLVVALAAIRTAGLLDDWRQQDADYARVVAALDRVRPGAVLVTAVGHAFELGDWVITRKVKPSHEHTGHYATIRNRVIVPNIFARLGQNPLVMESPFAPLMQVATNPVPRLFTRGDARWLVGQVAPIADGRRSVAPPITGAYIIAYHVPCELWPSDLRLRLVACEPGFSLVEVLGEDQGGPIP